MLNQQDCQRLQQQARYLEAHWRSSLPPQALWPLCLERERLHRRFGLLERFSPASPGLLAVESPLLPGVWQELPAEWTRPAWLRIERYQARKACLIWELSLEPDTVPEAGPGDPVPPASGTRLVLRLRFVLPPALQPPLQTYFKRLSQAIAQTLAELEAGSWPALPAGLGEGWQSFWAQAGEREALRRASERQLRLTGLIDPVSLARQAGTSLSAALSCLLGASTLLTPGWYALDADGAHALPTAAASWLSPRWQLADELQRRSLRFAPAQPEPSAPDQTIVLRSLLWPGQEREVSPPKLAPDATAPPALEWALSSPAGEAWGQLRQRPGSPAGLSLPAPGLSLLAPGGQLRLRHEPQARGPALFTLREPPGRAGDLLACEAAAPLLTALGELEARQTGTYLLSSRPLPAALALWLEGFLTEHDGARLAAAPRSLLLFARGEDALACAHGLLQQLRRAIARELDLPRLALALSRGPGQLHLGPDGPVLSGERLETLEQLLARSQGLDLLLPAELLAPLQARLPGWQLTELAARADAGRVFQLRPEG